MKRKKKKEEDSESLLCLNLSLPMCHLFLILVKQSTRASQLSLLHVTVQTQAGALFDKFVTSNRPPYRSVPDKEELGDLLLRTGCPLMNLPGFRFTVGRDDEGLVLLQSRRPPQLPERGRSTAMNSTTRSCSFHVKGESNASELRREHH